MDKGTFVVICFVLGLAVVAFSKHLARVTIRNQNEFFGFGFGEREEKGTRYVLVLIGAFFIVLGTLVLFGVLGPPR